MITEDYVSFETAKLLKEKGFDGDCYAYWDLTTETKTPKIGLSVSSKNWNYKWNPISFPISAPTLQMAMKWLRKIHSLEIYPYHNSPNNRHNSGWWFEIIKYPNSVAEYESGIDEEFDTHEEACEAAIKYCLENLI